MTSDGAATFSTPDGGWILVSNAETAAGGGGGASAIRFTGSGRVRGAYRILGGTSANCAGGPTPWGTWLSCEEHAERLVWECDPTGARPAIARPALGRFKHEAAAVDPHGRAVYLTEDESDDGPYRFRPDAYPDLSSGRLEVAVAGRRRRRAVDRGARSGRRRGQPAAAAGAGDDAGVVYVATTSDSRLHAYNTRRQQMTVVYDAQRATEAPLHNPDNVTVDRSGDVFVAEDTRAPTRSTWG